MDDISCTTDQFMFGQQQGRLQPHPQPSPNLQSMSGLFPGCAWPCPHPLTHLAPAQVRGAQQLPAPARRPVVPRSLGRVVGALVGFVAVSLFAACGQPPGRVKPRSRLLLPLQLAPAGLPRLRAGR